MLKLTKALHNSLLQCATPSNMMGRARQNWAGASAWITPHVFFGISEKEMDMFGKLDMPVKGY